MLTGGLFCCARLYTSMQAVIDTRQSYLDENGDILSAGRLIVYKFGTTEYADIFQDSELTLPLDNPLGLSSASWTSTQVYAGESLTVLVQKYEGLDEFDQPIFSTVKTFDSMASASNSGGSSGSISLVDTIEDLRNINGMVDTQIAMVKGYSSPSDCYVRKYIWSELSMAIDNGGTIISSLTSPTGRWILLFEGNTLDIRAFGVLPGATDVNSQLRAACNWASPNKVTLIIPTGTYNLTSSGTFDCYAALDVAEGVKFNRGIFLDPNPSNWYQLNLHNPHTNIRTTFAGVCVKLTINGEGWENTIVPITAFDNLNCRGYSHGTANYHLSITTNGIVYRWEQNCSLSAVSVTKGYVSHQLIYGGVTITVDHLEGEGKVSFNQTDATWHFRELDTRLVGARASYAMVNTSQLIYLTSAVTLHAGADITAYVEASGLGSLNTTDGSCKMRGGYGGKPNFILSGYGLDVGYHTIRQDYFASPEGLVRTWNLSTGATGILDLGRVVSTEVVSRNGIIFNGSIGGVTSSEITLDKVTVNGDIASTYVNAKYSTINGALPNLTSSKFDNVTINTSSTVTCTYGVWNEVSIPSGNITSTGGAFRLRDVFTNRATFIPNASKQFANASWEGGSSTGIYFDATQMSPGGTDALAYNVVITGLLGLGNNINAVNGTTKAWRINGHYNIKITDNEGINTRRTEGQIFELLSWRYNQLNSNSTLAGWDMAVESSKVLIFKDGTKAEKLQLHYLSAEKATDTPDTQYLFFPANQYRPYPLWQVVPCMQQMAGKLYFRFYVGAGAVYYSNPSQYAYADPGVVGAQHYCVNFKIYP